MEENIVNVVICYNNAKEVINYIKELERQINCRLLRIVVVVNSETTKDRKYLSRLADKSTISVMVVRPNNNLGYMKGLIFGYREYRKKYAKPKYVIFSNTDIEIDDISFVKNLYLKNYDEKIWCIGPAIRVKGSSNYCNPVADKRRSKKEIKSLVWRFKFPVISTLYVYLSGIKQKIIKNGKGKSHYVYEVHGCFFILKGDCAERLGDHYFKPLMYSEEAFISEIVYENGKKEFYDNELEITHLEHSVTGLLSCRVIAKYLAESMEFIKEEFYD